MGHHAKLAAPRLLVFALSVVLAACGGDNGPDAGGLPDCTGDVTVSVSAGTVPTFDWTPRCRLYAIAVRDWATGNVYLWSLQSSNPFVETENHNELSPPLKYGVSPSGTVTNDPPQQLQPGTAYFVQVIGSEGVLSGGVIIGIQQFTP